MFRKQKSANYNGLAITQKIGAVPADAGLVEGDEVAYPTPPLGLLSPSCVTQTHLRPMAPPVAFPEVCPRPIQSRLPRVPFSSASLAFQGLHFSAGPSKPCR